jgi:hypothetical protein
VNGLNRTSAEILTYDEQVKVLIGHPFFKFPIFFLFKFKFLYFRCSCLGVTFCGTSSRAAAFAIVTTRQFQIMCQTIYLVCFFIIIIKIPIFSSAINGSLLSFAWKNECILALKSHLSRDNIRMVKNFPP